MRKIYYSEKELDGLIKPTMLCDRPINPKTGEPYAEYTKQWYIWYYCLSWEDKAVVNDLGCQ